MKRLVVITDAFPWGKGEKSFLMPELPYLKQNFDLTILSRAPQKLLADENDRTILDKDIHLLHYEEPELGRKELLRYVLQAFFSKELREEMKQIRKENGSRLCKKETYIYWIRAVKFRKWMQENGVFEDLQNKVFYSYWANYSVFSLALEKEKQADLKFVSRMHGYDLYNERFPGGRQPFRAYVNNRIDKIVFIAKVGYEYYLKHFAPEGSDCDKYVLCKMGVAAPERCPEKKEDTFRLVSCSAVSELKRVDLIAKALQKMEGSIEWHHFGSGYKMEELKQLTEQLMKEKSGIRCVLHGHVEHEELMRFYNENYVDCFITTSSSEGCPVSIQEALSYGIPVIGTDVGEIKHMIDGCGVLLPSDPKTDEIAKALMTVYEADRQEKESMRKHALAVYKRDHQLEANTAVFIHLLKNL